MAKENAKRNRQRNATRMYVFDVITIIVNVVYITLIMYRNGGLPRFRNLFALAFWAGQEYISLHFLKQIAAPTYNAQGELVYCIDASNPQELGYYNFAQDMLWMCWVVQTLCNVHFAFIVFYLPVPATLIYKT
uniref:Transmembrane protein 208 n=1 Tax=Lygus hesperus TaxID=30085 RepID=A0A0A9XT67_LYGHE